jgi:RNA polymerase-binding transcription factor DksA
MNASPQEVTMGMKSKETEKLCSLCGRPIARARLEALPGVTTCIECAKKHPRKVDTRKVELSQASAINRNGFAPYD